MVLLFQKNIKVGDMVMPGMLTIMIGILRDWEIDASSIRRSPIFKRVRGRNQKAGSPWKSHPISF